MKIEILNNPGIDFYSGFRKNDQGGVQIEILKKIQVETFIVASGKLSRRGAI